MLRLSLAGERGVRPEPTGSIVLQDRGDARPYWRTNVSGTALSRWVDNGSHEVPASPHDRTVGADLHIAGTLHELTPFSPKTIPAGTAPVTITFDPAEIRALLDAAKKEPGK
jgi:hypothetical protein